MPNSTDYMLSFNGILQLIRFIIQGSTLESKSKNYDIEF